MTRQNEYISQTFTNEDQNKNFSLLEMWCEDVNLFILGFPLHDSDEDDYFQEQHERSCQGLVSGTWQLHQVAGKYSNVFIKCQNTLLIGSKIIALGYAIG